MSTRVILDRPGLIAVEAESVDAARLAADLMAQDMRRYVPVDTGELKASIRVEDIPGGARISIGDVAAGVDYHLYQEFGTSIMAAQPYIRPAVYQYRSL
jgi:HK97 gp10 family phage protein